MSAAIGGSTPPDPAKMGEIMKRHGLIPAPSLGNRLNVVYSHEADVREPLVCASRWSMSVTDPKETRQEGP